MKKVIGITALALALGFSYSANAQAVKNATKDVKEAAKEAGHDVKKGAKKAGNKTAELASKGAHHITDQVYKDKVGPNGQTIYIDNKSQYYWIDDKGHKQYVTEAELKPKE
jgi:gas vesicle protein